MHNKARGPLNEVFDLKSGEMVNKYNKKVRIVYIDPKTSESVYPYKDKVKAFGGRWDASRMRWYWVVGKDYKKVYDEQIKPCLEYLTSVEKTSDGKKRDVIAIIDNLISGCESSGSDDVVISDVKARLMSFKEDLINTVSGEEFKSKLEGVIKFRAARGRGFSFANSILIWLQMPEAKMVKSASNWRAVNREVKPGSKPIALFVPVGHVKKNTPLEKERITREFLSSCGVKSLKDLTIAQREQLKVELNRVSESGVSGFKLQPSFYDYSQTVQMAGREDMVGDPDAKVDWYDKSETQNDEITAIYESLIKAITDIAGIKVEYVPESSLGGALGVSTSGLIKVVEGPTTLNKLDTLIHEYSHELMHQKYLKSNNSELASYFIGTKEGRGKVEQQAELCSWIVLKNYGYDLNNSINYTGIWGLNEKNAADVFDTVLKVSEIIVKQIETMSASRGKNGMNESVLNEEAAGFSNGYELAEYLGFGDVYRRSYLKKNKEKAAMLERMTRHFLNLI